MAAEEGEQGHVPAASIPSPVLLAGVARQAFQLYRSNLPALALCFLPFIALTAAILVAIGSIVTVRASNLLLLLLVRDVIRIVLMSFGVAAAVIVLADRLAGQPGSVRGALGETMRAAPTIALGALLAAFPYVFAFFMFGPAMATLLRGLFLGPPIVVTAIVLERRRLGDAANRARELLALNWSRILLYLITITAGLGLLDFMVQYGLRVGAAEADLALDAVAIVVGILLPALLLPFIACVWLIVYFDLRARAEGFDKPAMIALRTPQQ